ncbi:hypothetical protein PL321_03200 [Caloramator sp. mosi_1]|uniref:hypothetical protein n=1 Tax=Caloramator sp. mosi_1 TaxID=3023090 RepID=UPI0023610046|nr:hypothetical protein [Caloramator sp. mosi_1]WDC84695.1 hypothetical protein PL321_03200 [Caloramator sp. mosi_1]
MKRRWAALVMSLIVSIFAFTYVLSYLKQDKDTKEVSYELTKVKNKKNLFLC